MGPRVADFHQRAEGRMDSFVDRLSPLAAIAKAGERCAPALQRYNALSWRLIDKQAVMEAC